MTSAIVSGGAKASLETLADDFWEFRVSEHPPEATLAGEARFNGQLGGVSIADYERRSATSVAMLERASAIDASGLDAGDSLTLSLLIGQLENIHDAHRLFDHLTPQLLPIGFAQIPPYLVGATPLQTLGDFENLIARLNDVPRYFDAHLERMTIGMARGFRVPRVLAARICGLTEAELAPSGIAAAVRARFDNCPPSLNPEILKELRRVADTALQDAVLPAYRKVLDFYEGNTEHLYRDSISACDQPEGRAYYCFKVRQQTTTELTPDDIHAIGLSEVAAIRAQLAALIADSGFGGDVEGFRKHHDTDAVEPDAESLLARASAVAKTIDGKIPQLFGRLPRSTYGLRLIGIEQSAHRPVAMAQAAPADRSLAGILWLTALPERCPRHQLLPLSLHEAWPGHLMQFALAQEMDHLPNFRRRMWHDYNAYVEGWALYCERLGYDLGLYDNPNDRYGQISFDLWRAARLVVDTGIHWKRWSREDAIAYMAQNTMLPLAAIEVEVDRYIAMPAQALSYKIGEIAIRNLRERAQTQLGDTFSLRDFHDAVLATGAVSLSALEQVILRWIDGASIR